MLKLSICRPSTNPKVWYDCLIAPQMIMGIICYSPPQIYLVDGEVYNLNPAMHGDDARQIEFIRSIVSTYARTYPKG